VKQRTVARISLGLVWTTAVLGLASVVAIGLGAAVTFGGGNRSSLASALGIGLAVAIVAMGISLLGMLMVRRAHNVIGWAFQAMAVSAVASLSADAALQLTLGRSVPIHPPGISVAGWISNISLLWMVLPIPAIFLLFPTGHPLSSPWRWAIRLWAVGVAVTIVWAALRPGEVYGNPPPDRVHVDNPFGLDAAAWLFPPLAWIAGMTVLAAAVLGIVSLVVRFLRSRGEERAQMRWLAFAGVIAALLVLAEFATALVFGDRSRVSETVGAYLYQGLVLTLLVGIPVSVAIAILRYRLYDLDVVIRKTVVFGLLAVFITMVYVGIVGGIGAVVGSQSSTALSFAAAAALALLFQPARDRARRLADRLVYGERATPYEVLSEFSGRVGETYAADDVFPRMAQVLAAGTGAETAAVWLRVGGELRPAAVWPAGANPGSGDHVEVRHQGETLGELSVRMPANDAMNPARRKLVEDLAAQAGLVLRNGRLIEELRASRQRLVAAQDEERRRIERNIHDGAQQQLVALAVKQRLAASVVGRDDDRARAMLEELQSETNQALEDLRDLARGVYPPLLADQGLAAALQAQARKSAVPVDVMTDGVGRFPQEVEAAVYFSCLEALQNVAKYSGATWAVIRLAKVEGELRFEVEDDGTGFDASATSYGSGLQGMADRLDALGGRIAVRSAPGSGTTITGVLPLAAIPTTR
jgi:signal transduction histidine kinase